MKKKSLGLMKIRTYDLEKAKEDYQKKVNRFKKEENKVQEQIQDLQVGEFDAQFKKIYESTIQKMDEIKSLTNEIQNLGTKRIKMQFGDTSAVEKQIYDTNNLATMRIGECEKNIELFLKIGGMKSESDQKVRKNIQRSLAQQVQELATNLRNQQKRMINLMKQVNNDDGGTQIDYVNFLGQFLKVAQEKEYQDLSQTELDMDEKYVEERDQEINKLVEMINNLAVVFKSLNQLVIDQGTVLDRIDYNIETTVQNVKKANIQLRKAEQYQSSPLARRCIIILVVLIVIFSGILTIKYTNN